MGMYTLPDGTQVPLDDEGLGDGTEPVAGGVDLGDLSGLSPEDYFGGGGNEDVLATLMEGVQAREDAGLGPMGPDAWDFLDERAALPSGAYMWSPDDYTMDPGLGLDTQYGGPDAPKEVSPESKRGGFFNPSTGQWEEPEAGWKKMLKAFLGDDEPQIDPRTGKPIPRQPSSPASSLAGMAGSAAKGASDARMQEGTLLLGQDRNRIAASQLELMREKYLRNQKAMARYRAGNRASNTRTPEQKAAAAAEEQSYQLPAGTSPTLNTLPDASWWEKMLAGYGIVGPAAQAIIAQLGKQ